MEGYKDLEYSILSCLLVEPELMKTIQLEDKHFINTQRMWRFMKVFYEKYNTLDISLMYSVCKDKWHIVKYIEFLSEYPALTTFFDKYQKQLLDLYNERKESKIIINRIYDLANELYVRKISIDEFRNEVNNICDKLNSQKEE